MQFLFAARPSRASLKCRCATCASPLSCTARRAAPSQLRCHTYPPLHCARLPFPCSIGVQNRMQRIAWRFWERVRGRHGRGAICTVRCDICGTFLAEEGTGDDATPMDTDEGVAGKSDDKKVPLSSCSNIRAWGHDERSEWW